MQLADGGDDAFDLLVAEAEGFGDGVFGDFERAGFDHHDGFFAAGDDDVQQALLLLGHGGIGDASWPSSKPTRTAAIGLVNGRSEINAAAEAAGDGDHVGIVFAIGGQHQGDDLRLIAPGLGKERAERPVDQARGQDFALGGAAFALEESAGNFSGGIGVLAIVDRQRQKIAVVGCASPCRR